MRDAAEAEARRALRRVLILLTVASTIVVATEFIVAGLLPVLARDLQISLAKAGNLVSAFAFSAAVIGPLLTLAATRAPPRVVLAGSLLAFAGGNVVAVLASSYGVLLGVRCVQGALLPVFISVGTAAVSALTPPERRGRALALANTGFVIGTIVAMPAGVALAADGVWWPAFLGLAFLGVIAAGLMATSFPDVSVARNGTVEAAGKPAASTALLQPPVVVGGCFHRHVRVLHVSRGVAGASGLARRQWRGDRTCRFRRRRADRAGDRDQRGGSRAASRDAAGRHDGRAGRRLPIDRPG